MRACWLLSLLLLLNVCSSPFPPRTLVQRLRVLGIRAEPAYTNLKDSITLTALVADPTGNNRALSATWVVCLSQDSSLPTLDCPEDKRYSLPSDGMTLQLSIPPELSTWLEQLGVSISGTDSSVIPSIPIGFVVSAENDQVQAVKHLPLQLDDSVPPNHNPVLTGLEVDGTQVGMDPIQLPAGKKITLKPLVDESSRETFIPAGETTARQEDFVFSWFSTIGKFDYSNTISAANNQGARLDGNRWSIPKTLPENVAAEGFLWLVVRDGRYGTDWMVFPTQFEP